MKPADHTLSRAESDELREALEAKRAELVGARREVMAAATHQEDSLSDPMDAATRATDEAELLGLAEHERALLGEVDHALTKLADGRYGVSERSGRPIPIERLRAVPWARLAADEEEEREHRR